MMGKLQQLPPGLIRSAWRRKFRLLLLAALCAAVVAFVSVSGQLARASGYITLDFESAHQGLTPSGTRFNIYDIKKEDVLQKALDITGLADKMSWRELADCLTVVPSRTQSVSKRYIATEYLATLTRTEAFGGVNARSLLDVIYRLYYERFIDQCGLERANLDADWTLLADMEYQDIGAYLKMRTDILAQFLQGRIDGGSGYDNADPALSFRALLSAVETFRTVNIDKFTALVSQSRFFKDAAAYQNILTYRRMLIAQDYQLSRAQFDIREQAIKDYEESLVAIVMVPTYYAGNGLYMSRTQTGIDTLTKAAESYSFINQKQALKLADIDAALNSVLEARNDAQGRADALLESVKAQFDELVASVRRADEAYVNYTARGYLSFAARNIGLMEAYSVKYALAAAVGAVGCAALLYWYKDMRALRPRARRRKDAPVREGARA